jgi:DNA primase
MINDILELKWRLPLPDLLKQTGLGAHAKRSAACPLHEDTTPSFSVF